MRIRFFTFIILVVISYTTANATIRYVKPTAAGSGNGSSWANASNNIAAMITASVAGDQIWIATGTYVPAATLSMKNGVAIYGGFLGNETLLTQRNFAANPTIISGGGVRQVFNNSNLNNTAVMDGCIISNGNSTTNGAGMYNSYAHPTILNCVFKDNVCNSTVNEGGGGLFNYFSNPNINNCVFVNNTTNNGLYGGGMHNDNSNPTINNSIFIANTAIGSGLGGGIFNYSSNPIINNTVFTGNSAPDNEGGGMYNSNSNPVITNTIIYGNTAATAPNLSNQSSTPVITFSNIEGGYSGTGNINADPLFVNTSLPAGADGKWMTADDGLQVQNSSPCILAGTTGAGIPITDILAVNRSATKPTIGAYENTACLYQKIFVNKAVAISGNGSTWATAKKTIEEALTAATNCPAINTIWIAAGTYIPTATLSMQNGLVIMGGFAGNETNLSQRNFTANPTIISGGNVRQVFYNNGLNNTAVLDGCTISNGSTTTNGGGMYNVSSSPVISNCVFTNNIATNGSGGAMANFNSGTNIVNCVFSGNSTLVGFGGAMYNIGNTNLNILSSVFIGNTAVMGGGAIYSSASTSYNIINCTITGNAAGTGSGGGVFCNNSTQIITNTIIWGNTATSGPNLYAAGSAPTVTYSNIQGGFAGTGNIYVDPQFIKYDIPPGLDGTWITTDDGLQLRYGFLFNGGTNGANIPQRDILGATRTGGVTMGAYQRAAYPYRKLYVNKNVATAGDGVSWATAIKTIEQALQLLTNYYNIDTIWIAAGTYTPTSTLSMQNGVAIFGGFAGNETLLSQRNYNTNITEISGNNVRRVFYNNLLNNNSIPASTAVLDGCTISNGRETEGAGMYNYYSDPTIRNCKFTNNIATTHNGGGILNVGSSPTIDNCVFSGNFAIYGGGIRNFNSNAVISNCVFTNNSATNGGGLNNENTTGVIVKNSVFTGNSALSGGGIYNSTNGGISISNCVIFKNNAGAGGGIFNYTASPVTNNSIIYSNTGNNGPNIYLFAGLTPITYSNIEGLLYPGTGNIYTNPLFVDINLPAGADGIWMTEDDGLALQPCSPSINTGTTTTPALPTDILGNNRVGAYDMGAYEYQGNVSGLAPVFGSQLATVTQTQAGTTVYSVCQSSHLIATVLSNGGSAIAGSTTAKVWVEATQPAQFVKRHYEITPAANAATATGRVTLYFTQAEFTAFNTQTPSPALLLPTDPADATGKANLRIEKRGGVSSDGSGLPGTYSGAITTIDPVDTDIVWNATVNRWEVSFDVTGFSGFFVKTQAVTLPLRWLSILSMVNAQKLAQINWQVQETAVTGYEVEKSKDAINFNSISYLQSKGDGNNSYQFTEPVVLDGIAYYRIKQTDRDGKVSYSSIVKLSSSVANKMQVYPSPFTTGFTVVTAKPQTIIITDISGRVLKTLTVNTGSNYIPAENLPAGIYLLKTSEGYVLRVEKL